MFLDSNHVLKVYFKSSRKNQDFLFLPLPSVRVWLKIRYLTNQSNLLHLYKYGSFLFLLKSIDPGILRLRLRSET